MSSFHGKRLFHELACKYNFYLIFVSRHFQKHVSKSQKNASQEDPDKKFRSTFLLLKSLKGRTE